MLGPWNCCWALPSSINSTFFENGCPVAPCFRSHCLGWRIHVEPWESRNSALIWAEPLQLHNYSCRLCRLSASSASFQPDLNFFWLLEPVTNVLILGWCGAIWWMFWNMKREHNGSQTCVCFHLSADQMGLLEVDGRLMVYDWQKIDRKLTEDCNLKVHIILNPSAEAIWKSASALAWNLGLWFLISMAPTKCTGASDDPAA